MAKLSAAQVMIHEVKTYGNRHRLTIVATVDRNGYQNRLRFESATRGRYEYGHTNYLAFDADGQKVETDWQVVAVMIGKAYIDGQLQTKHVYRVPAWSLMPERYKQALFNLFVGRF